MAAPEKWFEIQDELFADDVRSIEPKHSPWFMDAYGNSLVRKKREEWVKRIESAHNRYTTEPIVADNHFVVGRMLTSP
jgi:hypothetical protein